MSKQTSKFKTSRAMRISAMVVVFGILISFSLISVPRPAHALLGVGDISFTTITANIPGIIWRAVDQGLKIAADTTFKNQVSRYLNTLAYNTAVKIAAGGEGQKPLIKINLKTALQDAGDQAIGIFAQELLTASTGGGKCEFTGKECVSNSQCPLVAQTTEEERNRIKKDYILVSSQSDFDSKISSGEVRAGTLRRDVCKVESNGDFAGLDICNIQTPAAEIVIKRIVLDTHAERPPKPRCSFNDLKASFNDLKQIDREGLVRVTDHFNSRSNEIGVILNLTTAAEERRTAKIEQEKLESIIGGAIGGVFEKVGGKLKSPPEFVKTATEESFFRTPFRSYLNQTGSLVADAIGVFTNTISSKVLNQVFEKGFNPDSGGLIRRSSLFGGLSGVSAARIKFADLLKLEDVKTNQQDSESLLQQLVAGCDVGGGTSNLGSVDPDAFRETNNCVIGEQFRFAIDQRLTIKEAISQGLIDGTRDFGVHADGTGSSALAGTSCNGCDPTVYSTRSILILKKHRIVPVGWELAARYIDEVIQEEDGERRSYSLEEIMNNYSNPESPFYRLIDPYWQLKAPIAISEVRGPGEKIISEQFVRTQDTNGDQNINFEDEPTRIIQRANQVADEQTCIFEDADGNCSHFGYCVEEKPIWRVRGEECSEGSEFESCQSFVRSSDQGKVSYLEKSADQATCNVEVAGCRRYATQISPATGTWENNVSSPGFNVYLDRDSRGCPAGAEGCEEFLRLTSVNNQSLDTPEVDNVIQTILALIGGIGFNFIDNYSDYALVEKVYLNNTDNQLDCTSTVDYDGNSYFDDNVACKLYTPNSGGGPDIPGVVNEATRDANGIITAYNDQCPAACVGYSPFTETAYDHFSLPSRTVNFIANSAQQCSAPAEGCTEFTNLNDVASGGEGKEYYTFLRYCVTEDSPGVETFFTWEGSEDTGFQLRTWQLQADSSGPIYAPGTPPPSGTDCSAAVYNLPPNDPAANPDCREYLQGDPSGGSLQRYYALHSRVVFGTDECQPLRRTGDGAAFSALPSLSTQCVPSEVGCRRYQGNNAGNSRTVLISTFEDGTNGGWTNGGTGTSGLANSTISVNLGGHSLAVQGAMDLTHEVDSIEQKNYIVSFWATGAGSLNARIEGADPSEVAVFSGSAALTPEWNQYTLGPAAVTFDPRGTESIIISGWSGVSNIDNISLIETEDRYLISESWQTPAECQQPAPNGQLYCESYTGEDGNPIYLKSFTRLCNEEFLGCEALVQTHNSDTASPQTHNGSNTSVADNITVPADNLAYIVNRQEFSCSQDHAGCTELGQVFIDRDADLINVVTGSPEYSPTFASDHKILDPDEYDTALCFAEQELCEEYQPEGASAGFPVFFKDPQDRTCEYKRNVAIVGVTNPDGSPRADNSVLFNGWFRANANPVTTADICKLETDIVPRLPVCNMDPATGEFVDGPYDNQGLNTNVLTPGAPGCYTYTCPADQSSCTEFQDPINPPGCDKLAAPDDPNACDYYYLIKDTLQDGQAECRGQIDSRIGCIGFFEPDRGEQSKFLRADCQPGCPLLTTADPTDPTGVRQIGTPVTEYPDCSPDPGLTDPNSKPGCIQ